MSERLFATFDRAHIRVYRERANPSRGLRSLELIDALDLPSGKASYTEGESDQAGRFPGSRGLAGGMGIDERLPMQRERDRRLAEMIAEHLHEVLSVHAGATWHCAAGPDLQQPVLERLRPQVRSRLERTIPKDLTNAPVDELREHFIASS